MTELLLVFLNFSYVNIPLQGQDRAGVPSDQKTENRVAEWIEEHAGRHTVRQGRETRNCSYDWVNTCKVAKPISKRVPSGRSLLPGYVCGTGRWGWNFGNNSTPCRFGVRFLQDCGGCKGNHGKAPEFPGRCHEDT